MLQEIAHIRQSNRRYIKRWFTSRDMDLFIWLRKSVPVRFQLSYNKLNNEQAISWDLHRGFHHHLVDSGETLPDHYKQTPLLIDLHDQHELAIIARRFLAACENIDIGVADFIYARLMGYPIKPVQHSAMNTDRPRL